jgi:hypothetical protein
MEENPGKDAHLRILEAKEIGRTFLKLARATHQTPENLSLSRSLRSLAHTFHDYHDQMTAALLHKNNPHAHSRSVELANNASSGIATITGRLKKEFPKKMKALERLISIKHNQAKLDEFFPDCGIAPGLITPASPPAQPIVSPPVRL